MVGVETARNQPMLFHELEPIRENRRRNPCEGGLEVLEAPRSSQQIAHNQEGPPVAEHLQRFGNWTGLIISFWHRLLFIPLATSNLENRSEERRVGKRCRAQ